MNQSESNKNVIKDLEFNKVKSSQLKVKVYTYTDGKLRRKLCKEHESYCWFFQEWETKRQETGQTDKRDESWTLTRKKKSKSQIQNLYTKRDYMGLMAIVRPWPLY